MSKDLQMNSEEVPLSKPSSQNVTSQNLPADHGTEMHGSNMIEPSNT
jgi:hypothetical protein